MKLAAWPRGGSSRRRCSGPSILATSGAPTARAEQAGSQLRRVQAGLLDAGSDHGCAVLAARQVRCWGTARRKVRARRRQHEREDETPASAGPVDIERTRAKLTRRARR